MDCVFCLLGGNLYFCGRALLCYPLGHGNAVSAAVLQQPIPYNLDFHIHSLEYDQLPIKLKPHSAHVLL